MSRGILLRHRAEHLGFRLLRGLVSSLPRSWAQTLGEALGWTAGAVLGVRRTVVEGNLKLAFPDRSRAWRRRVALASYRHLGRELVVTLRLPRETRERILETTEVQGLELLRAALDEGRGLVAFCGHLGNWEVAGAALAARGLPVDSVMHPPQNPFLREELERNRARLGITLHSRESAPRTLLASLRAGRVVGLVADQNAVGSGVVVDFFGAPASTARGPAVLSLRSGAPMWALACRRVDRRPLEYQVICTSLEVARTGDLQKDVMNLTQAAQSALEASVRKTPEQYFWVHKRWKVRRSVPNGPRATVPVQ